MVLLMLEIIVSFYAAWILLLIGLSVGGFLISLPVLMLGAFWGFLNIGWEKLKEKIK